MLRYLYNLLFYAAVPYILCRLWWRSRKNKAYKYRWRERFALQAIPSQWQNSLWIHAVSVGEVIAAVPLVKAIQSRYPDLPIVMTTMTPTGSEQVRKNFPDSVFHCYVPYDIPFAVKRFLSNVKPKALMLLETELWPNILHYCQQTKVPVMLANARLSARSAKGYGRFSSTMRSMLSAVTVLAAHAKEDGERFVKLGLAPEKLTVTGSIKFELQVPASLTEQADELRNQLGQNRSIWIAASTHEGEDEPVLQAHQKVLEAIPNALLILVPRHPERFLSVYALCKKQGFNVVKRSREKSCASEIAVYLGDTMGELLLLFSASDIAFVGGSLVPHGGHNFLEPAAVGVPTLTGPHTHNFTRIKNSLVAAGATQVIHNADELAQTVINLLNDSYCRNQMAESGLSVLAANKGALAAHMKLLELLV